MKELDKYNTALDSIYKYFGFKEDWSVFPIDDARKYWWKIEEPEVIFWASKEAYDTKDEDHQYSNEIFHHCHYPKAVYEGKDYTMIIVDTHTDGNQFLQIFDNAKKL